MKFLTRGIGLLVERAGRPLPVEEGVFQIRTLGARVTVVIGQDSLLLVDAGGRGSRRIIDAGLNALGASLADVGLIALTHYHPDHGGGLGDLAKRANVPVAVHRLEATYVRGEQPAQSPFRAPFLRMLTAPILPFLYSGPAAVDPVVEDGDLLPWSEEVRVIHTPGHTPGSICLYFPGRRLLIAGDAMQHRFRRLSPPASAVTLDREQAVASLRKLSELEVDSVCFGHFAPLRRDVAVKLQRLIAMPDGSGSR